MARGDGPEWLSVLQWTLWFFATSAVMGWVARSRSRAVPPDQATLLVHPPATLVIGAVTTLFFGAIAVISNVYANATTSWLTTAIFVGFAAMGVWTAASYFVERHDVTEQGIRCTSALGRRRDVRWSEITAVQWAPKMKWFRLRLRSGATVRISGMLVGLPRFARLLLAHAPHAHVSAETRDILEETAAGNPPSLWE